MGVKCDVCYAELSTDELRELDYRVMRHAFDSQNELGRLADERVYQADLVSRLRSAGISARREVSLQLAHQGFCKTLFLDVVVEDRAIYELKTVKAITEAHIGQLLTYLHLLDLCRGKIVNFRAETVETRFVNAPLNTDSRRDFSVEDSEFDGSDDFRELVVSLLRDWGTSLTLTLYQEAIVALLGGSQVAEVMLPIRRNGESLGTQRYQLASAESAFKLTAMNHGAAGYRNQLSRLIQFSDLRAIHWINIAHRQVTLTTVKHPN